MNPAAAAYDADMGISTRQGKNSHLPPSTRSNMIAHEKDHQRLAPGAEMPIIVQLLVRE